MKSELPWSSRRVLGLALAAGLALSVLAAPALGDAGAGSGRNASPAPERLPAAGSGGIGGEAIAGSLAKVETTAEIMARQEQAPASQSASTPLPRLSPDWGGRTGSSTREQGPVSPGAGTVTAPAAAGEMSLGLGFDGTGSTTNLCGTPPDTMGAVGPSQFILFVNCNIVSYNKATGAADGVLSTTPNVFFNNVRSASVSDPHIRYDRLTGRWFLVIIDTTFPNNRMLMAVSNGPVITLATTWSFFYFQTANGTHTNCLADYPTPGIDANAIDIGVNQFCGGSIGTASYGGSDVYVVPKNSVLGAGPVTLTAFQSVSDMWTPQGVDNADPAATEGYILGGSVGFWNRINLARVSNPGSASPTIASVVPIVTANQGQLLTQPHLGNTGGSNGRLDASDNRPMAAYYRDGSLWTAMGVGVSSSCAGVAGGTASRDAVFWWELKGIPSGSTPVIAQSGSVCDGSATNPLFYSYGSIMVNGQGHAVLGYTFTGAANYTSTGLSARLAGDTLGTLPSALVAVAGANAYNPSFDSGAATGRRWGDYSYTSVDPCDDMTMWTVQEYANPANQYRERVTQLKAPAPALPVSATPATIPPGQAAVTVTIVGASSSGSGFYDTPASMSGLYCRARITATVSGGVVVNSVTYTDPTHLLLSLSTLGAAPGSRTVTVTNPDGQGASAAVLQVISQSTATSLTAAPNPSFFGQTVVITATVSSVPPGGGSAPGSVTFYDGGASLGSRPLSAGAATLSIAGLVTGTHSITATYGGSAGFAGSGSAVFQQIVFGFRTYLPLVVRQ